MPRVKYRDADVALMARMMRAEAEGEGQQGMLYVGNVIVNRAVASCLDFNDVRTIEQVIYQVQGGNYSLKLFKRQYVLPTSERNGKRLAKQNLDFWREHPAKYALWYFNPYAPCPQHGMVSRLQDNLRIIAL